MLFQPMGIPEKIKAIQDEIHKTQINKATEFHIGLLKAKIAKLKREQEENIHGRTVHTGGENAGFDVRKAGDATVVLIGLPSVGKSTLLNRLTNAKSCRWPVSPCPRLLLAPSLRTCRAQASCRPSPA